MNVFCYGDSNTYGYDPRSFFGSRYAKEERWVDILSNLSGWNVTNDGLNGREIPEHAPIIPDDTDLMIIMLGVNDLLQGCTVAEVVDRMNRFLCTLKIDSKKLILISPPPLQRGEWVISDDMILKSHTFAEKLCELAEQRYITFVDTRRWGITMAFDGVHFTESGHRLFAESLYRYLRKGD